MSFRMDKNGNLAPGAHGNKTRTQIVLNLAPCDLEDLARDPNWWMNSQVIERAAIQTMLELFRGNKTHTAAALRIERRTLQRNLFWDPGIPDPGRAPWGSLTKKRKDLAHASQT